MPFVKGQSGNPAGRKPSQPLITPSLRRMLTDKGRDGLTVGEQVAAVLLSLARSGNVEAIKLVLDRVDGKVPNPLDLTSGGAPLIKAYIGVDLERI